MTEPIQFQTQICFRNGRKGRKHLEAAEAPAVPVEPGRVPRISRLMALAIRLDGLIRSGVVTDQAELARLGHVTRARISQIMNLVHLSAEIQEAVLFLPRIQCGRDPITDRQLRRIAAAADWHEQRRMWQELHAET